MAEGAGGSESPAHLVVGHVSKPHGTKGELFIWPLTDEPEAIFRAGIALLLGDEAGRLAPDAERLVIATARPFKRGVLVRFEGSDERSSAERLAGRYLLAATTALRPLGEGELFYHQLLGMSVETVAGERVGVVREVFDIEPAHLLEVKHETGRTHLIPFLERIVKQVDVAGRRMVIEPPPGLLEI